MPISFGVGVICDSFLFSRGMRGAFCATLYSLLCIQSAQPCVEMGAIRLHSEFSLIVTLVAA